MILSLIAWLAMQGQVRPWDNYGNCYIQQAISERSDGTTTSMPLTICDTPAEHVIEIKTVHHLPEGEDHCYVTTTVPNSGNDGKTLPCPPDTRELWIDGVRWGVVKGLE